MLCEVVVIDVLRFPGQRSSVIINANQNVGNYWFRAVAENSCASNTNQNALSIFSYDGAGAGDPTSTAATKPNDCINEGPPVPWVPNTVPSDAFTSQVKSLQVNIGPGVDSNGQNIVVWGVNLSAIDVDWLKPTYSYIIAGDTNYPSTENLIAIPNANTVSKSGQKLNMFSSSAHVTAVDILDYSRDRRCPDNSPDSSPHTPSRP